MFAASKSGSVDAKDPQFNYVTMLLHGNGTNGAQNNTFVDSSTNNFTITRNGNTTQGTFTPYGSNWSNYLGSNNGFALGGQTAFAFGTGDYTVECWFYKFGSAGAIILDFRPSSTNGNYPIFYYNSSGGVSFDINGSVLSSGSVALNTWNHVAYVRSSGVTKIYVNGTQSGSSLTDTANYLVGSARPNIGINGYTPQDYFDGYISNLRIVKGTAVYTTNFTPSTTPLTAISGTSLLTCQSNRFVDNSSNAFSLTVSGSPSVQRFCPFLSKTAYSTSVIGGSGYFDGSGDYLSAPSSSAYQFGSGDFTIECWVYMTGAAQQFFFAQWNSPNRSWGFLVRNSGTTLSFVYSTTGSNETSIDGTIAAQAGRWAHFAAVRNGNTLTTYMNGVSVASASMTGVTLYSATQAVEIGRNPEATTTWNLTGYAADVRVVKGTAVYTSAFTPPTAPVTAITNTSLLLSCTNAGILDNAMMNDLETVGNAQISTSVKKYGTGSMYFDGTGDNLSTLPSAGALGSGDWTVEFWWQWASATGDYQTVVSKGIVGGTPANGSWSFGPYQQANNIWFAYYNSGFTDVSAAATLNDGAWHHMAASRQGTSLRLFADGVLKVTATLPANLDFGPSTSDPFLVGYNSRNARYINGYVDDLRITKGVARYTATFTPPTATFADKG